MGGLLAFAQELKYFFFAHAEASLQDIVQVFVESLYLLEVRVF